MAQCVFQNMVNEKGMQDCFYIDSAATSREEIGNGPHYGTVDKLRKVGIPVVPHRARQMTRGDYAEYDFLIGMEDLNISYMERIAGGDPDGKMFKLLAFAGKERAIADPWYTGNFDVTYDDICEGLDGFWDYLEQQGLI